MDKAAFESKIKRKVFENLIALGYIGFTEKDIKHIFSKIGYERPGAVNMFVSLCDSEEIPFECKKDTIIDFLMYGWDRNRIRTWVVCYGRDAAQIKDIFLGLNRYRIINNKSTLSLLDILHLNVFGYTFKYEIINNKSNLSLLDILCSIAKPEIIVDIMNDIVTKYEKYSLYQLSNSPEYHKLRMVGIGKAMIEYINNTNLFSDAEKDIIKNCVYID
jgi:hypothetical protein